VHDKIVRTGLEPQHLVIRHKHRIREQIAPDIGKRRNNGRGFKALVNQTQPILNLVTGNVMQEQRRGLHPGASLPQGDRVKQQGGRLVHERSI
jgi:hypothetical protein